MRTSRDRVGFEIEASSAPERRVVDDEEPFQIALLGDFSGRAERGPIGSRKPVLIDRDEFEDVLEKLDVGIELPGGRIVIRDIDHFHPDHVFGSYPPFKKLRDMRERLADPETFPEAAREVFGEAPANLPVSGASLLEQMLSEGATAVQKAKPADPLQRIIEEAVRPHLVARQDARAPELIRQVDAAAADLMGAVLHHRKFQSVEAAWRAVFRVIRTLDTGPELKVFLVDISREELIEDPDAVLELLGRSGPWSVIAGDYTFGVKDLPLLTVLGVIAGNERAPFLGEADVSLLGSEEYAAFRRTAEAKQVGLALPRVSVRRPAAAESFEFKDDKMLFANPAFFCAMLLGQAFSSHGWEMKPGMAQDIAADSPSAELALTEDQALALIEQGFMPVASYRDRDLARVLMFQSVAASALPGRWD